MENKPWPHKKINERNNGLSSAQEVYYSGDFKRADRAAQTVVKEN
ncbi:YfhE family protein [Bacillus sp. A301a_S52]|nr:YfhE family protein [Bacillus sp. A301a_S52]